MKNKITFRGFFNWWMHTVKGRNLTADEWINITKKYENENTTQILD